MSNDSRDLSASIKAKCRLVRGDRLAQELGFEHDSSRKDRLYAVGYVYNMDGRTAYVRAKITCPIKETFGAEVKVNVIPGNKWCAEPFLALIGDGISDLVDVNAVEVDFQILEVNYK